MTDTAPPSPIGKLQAVRDEMRRTVRNPDDKDAASAWVWRIDDWADEIALALAALVPSPLAASPEGPEAPGVSRDALRELRDRTRAMLSANEWRRGKLAMSWKTLLADWLNAFEGGTPPEPNDGPADRGGRLMLNAYGRRCWDAGHAAAQIEGGTAEPQPAPVASPSVLVDCWRKKSAVNAGLAKDHAGSGWFTIYDDRRDIYALCAIELEEMLAAQPIPSAPPGGGETRGDSEAKAPPDLMSLYSEVIRVVRKQFEPMQVRTREAEVAIGKAFDSFTAKMLQSKALAASPQAQGEHGHLPHCRTNFLSTCGDAQTICDCIPPETPREDPPR